MTLQKLKLSPQEQVAQGFADFLELLLDPAKSEIPDDTPEKAKRFTLALVEDMLALDEYAQHVPVLHFMQDRLLGASTARNADRLSDFFPQAVKDELYLKASNRIALKDKSGTLQNFVPQCEL